MSNSVGSLTPPPPSVHSACGVFGFVLPRRKCVRFLCGGGSKSGRVEAGGIQLNGVAGYRQGERLPPGRVQAPESPSGLGIQKREPWRDLRSQTSVRRLAFHQLRFNGNFHIHYAVSSFGFSGMKYKLLAHATGN